MKLFTIFFFATLVSYGQIGSDYATKDFLRLEVDSVEMRITKHKRGRDTSYVLHYGIVNITSGTIFLNWQSCPSYRVFTFQSDPSFHNYNDGVCCSGTSFMMSTMIPNKKTTFEEDLNTSVSKKDSSKTKELNNTGTIQIAMAMHITKDSTSSKSYSYNSRDLENVKEEDRITFRGTIPFVETCNCAYWDKRCKRRERKEKLK